MSTPKKGDHDMDKAHAGPSSTTAGVDEIMTDAEGGPPFNRLTSLEVSALYMWEEQKILLTGLCETLLLFISKYLMRHFCHLK